MHAVQIRVLSLFFVAMQCAGSPCIERVFELFRRPVTVLDMLQDDGSTARSLLGRWPVSYVLMQPHITWKGAAHEQLIVLDHEIDLATLVSMECCEDFDIALFDVRCVDTCLLERALEVLGRLSLFSILRHVPMATVQHFVDTHDGFLIEMADDDVVVLRRISARLLLHNAINDRCERRYIVYSTCEAKFLYKPSFVRRGWRVVSVPWEPGINLQTFCSLGGVIPKRQRLVDLLYRGFESTNQDPLVRNIIVQGDAILFIDCTNDKAGTYDLRLRHRIDMFAQVLRAVDPTHVHVDRSRLFANKKKQ